VLIHRPWRREAAREGHGMVPRCALPPKLPPEDQGQAETSRDAARSVQRKSPT
jgi:hypothetical protein